MRENFLNSFLPRLLQFLLPQERPQASSVLVDLVIMLTIMYDLAIHSVNAAMTLEQCCVLRATPVGLVVQGLLAHIVISLVEQQGATLLADHVAKVGNVWGKIMYIV